MKNQAFGAIGTAIIIASALIGAPAFADPLPTNAFLANLSPNIDFLDQSSRLALTNSKAARLRDFARTQAIEQTRAANSIYDWSNPKVDVASVSDAPVQTGRSVAIDQKPTVDTRLPHGQEDLDALYGAEGKDFDTLYIQGQRDALTQVEGDYRDYIANGNDPALKVLAAQELPKVRHSLDVLNKL